MDSLPGMNECKKGPSDSCRAIVRQFEPLVNRKIILIATATIQNDSLFVNGLFQNVFILYKLFDAMGYTPILLINDKPKSINDVPQILRYVRMITLDDIAKKPIPIHIYLEIGMSIDHTMRKVLHTGGARIAKLYLGNILNIDTETPLFYPAINFSHHVVGELNEIWVSPHYKQHDEYAAVLNHVDPLKSLKIAPYVWDPCILTLNNTRTFQWRPRNSDETETIVVLEPNISFQKSALIPILIVEQSYRLNKRPLEVLIGNGERLLSNPFFTKTILPTLELYKDKKITFSGRHTITDIMKKYSHATAICHQWNNQYNYMTLEYLTAGFPVIHNAPDWHDAGYFYKGHSISEGVKAFTNSMQHASMLEQYKSGAETIRWRHSIYNPEVQLAWKEILG